MVQLPIADFGNCDTLDQVLLKIPRILEDPEVFLDKKPTMPIGSPVMVMESMTIEVIAEDTLIFKSDVSKSVAAYMALHTIFNLKYQKELSSLGVFEILFGLDQSVKSSKRKFISIVNNLKK